MGTPMAFTSGTTNGFSLGATKRATVAVNPATSLVSGNNWFNGVDVSTQYLIYSDTFSQGQAPITTARPTAWTTPDLTDASLLALINTLPDRVGQVPYTDINVALQWLQNSEKYFLIKNGYDDIVTNGLIANLDAGWYNSYPGNTSSIASSWTDYNNSQAYYTPISNNGVILYSTTTNWVGYFPATVNTVGMYTIEFDYVTNDAGTLVLDNDGIVDNEWNASIANTTTQQKYKVTRYIGTTGNINFFLRRSSGGNHTITNFSFTNANTWFDLSGQGNNAILANSPTFTADNGGTLIFDGVDDYAYIPDNASIDLAGDKSYGIWIKLLQDPGSGGFIGKANSTVNGMALAYGWAGNGFQNIAWNSVNAPNLSASASDINNWYYIAGVQNGATRYIYVIGANGIRSSSYAGGNDTWNNSLNLTIGQVTGYYEYISVGAVHIYNRALSLVEVSQNYDAQKSRFGLGGQSLFSGVTQYFDFSKQSSYPGTGANLNDISGNGYNDTITSPEQVKYIDGVKCLDCSVGAQINGDVNNAPTLGNNYTIFTWARVISSTDEWRTLLRTYDDDHPLLVQSGGNAIGYYDNNGGGFVASSLSVSTLGLANRWVLYTIVGSSGTQQTFYINEGTSNSTVSANATGEKMDDICNHSGQIFGPVGSCVVYNNQSFTQSQVLQYFNATKQYYGYNAQNVLTYGLITSYDAGNPISYPGTGTTWYDLTGNGNNGTLYNSPTYSNGEISFDGLDDYMQANILNTLLDGDPNFSVEFFVKRTSNFVNSGFWGIGGAGQGYSIEGWTPTQNEIHLDLYDSTRLSSGQYYPLNTYVHVVWAKQGTAISTSTVNLYINGVLTNLTLTRNQTTGPRYNTSTPGVGIALGRLNGNSNSFYAPITIGVFRIYDRQLTQGEVLNNYNAQKARFGL